MSMANKNNFCAIFKNLAGALWAAGIPGHLSGPDTCISALYMPEYALKPFELDLYLSHAQTKSYCIFSAFFVSIFFYLFVFATT